MKLILVNAPDLTIITPSPGASNAYLSFIIPADTVANITITPTVDQNMFIDGMNVCTRLSISISGKVGDSPYSDTIILNGESIYTTENTLSLILQGQSQTGPMGSTVTVTSCGQTSVMVD